MALAYPDRHPALLRFLASEADETDIQTMIYPICFILAFVCLFAVKRGPYIVAEAIAVAVVAGFLSPVISDFAATVNRWCKP